MGAAWAAKLKADEAKWVRGISDKVTRKVVREAKQKSTELLESAQEQFEKGEKAKKPRKKARHYAKASELANEGYIMELALVDYQAYKFFGFK